jgi:hypothetical protein
MVAASPDPSGWPAGENHGCRVTAGDDGETPVMPPMISALRRAYPNSKTETGARAPSPHSRPTQTEAESWSGSIQSSMVDKLPAPHGPDHHTHVYIEMSPFSHSCIYIQNHRSLYTSERTSDYTVSIYTGSMYVSTLDRLMIGAGPIGSKTPVSQPDPTGFRLLTEIPVNY